MTVFACPHCSTRLKVPDGLRAKQAKCPKCGRAVRISHPGGPEAANPLPRQDDPRWSTPALKGLPFAEPHSGVRVWRFREPLVLAEARSNLALDAKLLEPAKFIDCLIGKGLIGEEDFACRALMSLPPSRLARIAAVVVGVHWSLIGSCIWCGILAAGLRSEPPGTPAGTIVAWMIAGVAIGIATGYGMYRGVKYAFSPGVHRIPGLEVMRSVRYLPYIAIRGKKLLAIPAHTSSRFGFVKTVKLLCDGVLEVDLEVVPHEVDRSGKVLTLRVGDLDRPVVVEIIPPKLFNDEDLHHLVPPESAGC